MQHKSNTVSKLAINTTILAAALASGAAMAQSSVTLYGQVDVFIGATKLPGEKRAGVVNGGGMQTSYWGVKGSEDLGGGLKGIFDLNGFYRGDTGKTGRFDGDPMFTRNAYVGLESNKYGTIKLGRNTTPYFVSTILFNPLIDSYQFSPAVFHTYLGNNYAGKTGAVNAGIVGDSGWNNALLYTTPNFGGLTANVIYAFGEQAGKASANKWGGNLMYFGGPLAATLAFQQVKFNTNPVGDFGVPPGFDKQSAVLGGLSYDFKVVKVFAQAQYIKNDITGGDVKNKNAQLGVSVPVGAGNVLASFAYGKTTGGLKDETRKTAGLAYDYYLSKRTDVYAAYFYDKITDVSAGDSFGVGIRHKF